MVRRVYLLLAIAGAIAPVVVTALFMADHGVLDFDELGDQVFASEMSTLLLIDLSISSIAFWVWISLEAPRVGMTRWWPFVIANIFVGLCFALPLFLYLRARALEAGSAGEDLSRSSAPSPAAAD